MILELVRNNSKIIGWRLTVGDKRYLIWKDQEFMPGIRIGDRFLPSPGETIVYESIYKVS